WTPDVDPRLVAGLASTRTYPLRSSFRPSYNMAVNLVGTVGGNRARDLLESSFAQFQADRSVVGLARQVQRNVETTQTYAVGRADLGGGVRGSGGGTGPGTGAEALQPPVPGRAAGPGGRAPRRRGGPAGRPSVGAAGGG